jgi:ubiquinone/menaquinone biosynthesis C-methylase UbiE
MYRRLSLMTGWAACFALAVTVMSGDDTPPSQGLAPYASAMNKTFAKPDTEIQEFVKRFESESRDVFVKRHDITRAVGLRPGQIVADVGAGTGLFTELFAEQVGSTGTVYAVDISPAFLQYIAQRAQKCGYDQIVTTVLNTHDSATLPANSIDVAFICNTYHHFEHPERMLASIHRALRASGRLVIVDFDLLPDSGEFVKQRARAPKETYFREIAAAGFERIETTDAPVIKENFYVEFRRAEQKRPTQGVAPQPASKALE